MVVKFGLNLLHYHVTVKTEVNLFNEVQLYKMTFPLNFMGKKEKESLH